MRKIALVSALFCLGIPAFADVSLTDRTTIVRTLSRDSVASDDTPQSRAQQRAANLAKKAAKRAKRGNQADGTIGTNDVPLARQQLHAANLAKKAAKAAKRGNHAGTIGTTSTRPVTEATGSISLIDASGLEYFINTNITSSTSFSASGAASEASYTTFATNVTTIGGGFTTSTLNDAFDGYNSLCVSLTNATGPCVTGDPAYTIYNDNGPPITDASCSDRQVLFPTQVIGGLNVSRKVLVPEDDEYMRWLNTFTNTTGAPITFTMITGNDLGSDDETIIVSSDDGDAIAETTDTWVTTMENYSGLTSSDVRLGHVLQGDGAPTPVSNINFVNGDENPYWAYSITLAAGQTKSILNFVTGQPTKALAATEAERISQLFATASQCLSVTELSQITNFAVSADLSITKTSTPAGSVNAGQNYSYTLDVANAGPGTATSVSVSDPLPAGVVFVSASGTGWTCNEAAGTVTCTLPTLAVGSANPITINVTAPVSTGLITNTATVSSATADGNAANDSGSVGVTVSKLADLSITKTTTALTVYSGLPITYTLTVTNAGPTSASNVSVTDTLPAGAVFVSASGTGWTCNNAANVVTCTRPSLAVGAAPAITLTMNAPPTTTDTTLTNTATVSSTSSDPTPGNNAVTSAAIALLAAITVPALSPWMLGLLALALSATAWIVMSRKM